MKEDKISQNTTKEPKKSSELFHNIMKASVKGSTKQNEINKVRFSSEWVYSENPEKEGVYLVWARSPSYKNGYKVGNYTGGEWHFGGKSKFKVMCWMKLQSSPGSE